MVCLPMALLTGCMPRNATEGGVGPLSIPAAGETRIVSRQIGDKTADTLHWKWSLIAGSNWTKATADNGKLSLTQPYPLNDPDHIHGTNVWECDLTAERTKDAPNTVHWNATLHGSNGSTAKADGTTPLNGDIESTIRVLVDQDTIQKLPADISLAKIADKDLTLSLTR